MEIAKDDDRPPKEIWLDDEALNEFFEAVNERYADKAEGHETQGELEQNELTARFKKGVPR